MMSILIMVGASATACAGNLDSSYDINVLVIKYLHIDQNNNIVDPNIRTDVYRGNGPGYYWNYSSLTLAVQNQIDAAKTAIEKAATYRGTRTGTSTAPRGPALRYQLIYPKTDVESIGELPYIQPDPVNNPGSWYVDYNKILGANNICNYVDNKGVREVWVLKGNHKDAYNHNESRMAVSVNETFGEVANGGGSPLTRCQHTYRVYTHTYDRSDLFLEVWGHQLEGEMEHVSRNGVGPDLFNIFNIACYDNSLPPCYPMDTMGLLAPPGGFVGEYFNNMTLTGAPVLTRTDANIGFDWGAGGPAPSVPVDQFSVRWTGWVVPESSATYTFWTSTDDGVRLKIFDGVTETTVIDGWKDQIANFSGNLSLTAGQLYRITLEYYENGGGARIQLRWKNPSMPVPQAKIARCGTVHNAPNAMHEYNRDNPAVNTAGTDCMDWQPEGLGTLTSVSCSTWGCGLADPAYDPNNYNYRPFIFNNAVLNYSSWHWAYMPGRNNDKMYKGQRLRNWWDVHGDFDGVKTCNTTLLDSSACVADLGITSFRADPNPLIAGSAGLTYRVSAINNGPGTVPDGRVKITLPAGSSYVPNGSTSPDCYALGLTVTCYLGKLAQGGTRDFVLHVLPPVANSITATASTVLPGTFEDTVPDNNSASTVTTDILSLPTIIYFSPTSGPAAGLNGTFVIVTGTNFDPGFKKTTVSLNGVDAPILQVVSPEILIFMVPRTATTGKITVTTPAGSVTSVEDFTVIPAPPTITSISPNVGSPDTTTIVMVNGTNFVPGGQTKVTLNGMAVPLVQYVSPEILFFITPVGATTGKVCITTPFGTGCSPGNFTFTNDCTLLNPVVRVVSLGAGTGPTNEEIKVTFTGNITNAAAFTPNPTTSVVNTCAGKVLTYAATAIKGTLSCKIDNALVPNNGFIKAGSTLRCSNLGGGDTDTFTVR